MLISFSDTRILVQYFEIDMSIARAHGRTRRIVKAPHAPVTCSVSGCGNYLVIVWESPYLTLYCRSICIGSRAAVEGSTCTFKFRSAVTAITGQILEMAEFKGIRTTEAIATVGHSCEDSSLLWSGGPSISKLSRVLFIPYPYLSPNKSQGYI